MRKKMSDRDYWADPERDIDLSRGARGPGGFKAAATVVLILAGIALAILLFLNA